MIFFCKRPPKGWWCSRRRGHHGPCAARSTSSGIALAIWNAAWLVIIAAVLMWGIFT